MTGVDLHEARLEGAILGSKFRGVDLSGSFLGKSSLAGATMRRTNLTDIDLSSCDLAGADLREAVMDGAILGSFDADSTARLIGDSPKAPSRPIEESIASFEAFDRGETPPPPPPERDRGSEVRLWLPDFPDRLGPADLRGCYFSPRSRLEDVALRDDDTAVFLEGVHWGDADISTIEWRRVEKTGDELALEGKLVKRDHEPERLSYSYAEDESLSPKEAEKKKEERDRTYWKEMTEGALRTNRQLATALRSQGINEEADYFAYRARSLQMRLYRHQRNWVEFVGSAIMRAIAGYGFKPLRILVAYGAVIAMFSLIYWSLASQLDVWEAVVYSAASFHGRGIMPSAALTSPIFVASMAEAILGLFVEAVLIATFAQRFLSR